MLMLRLTVLFDPLRVFLPVSGILMLLAIIVTAVNIIQDFLIPNGSACHCPFPCNFSGYYLYARIVDRPGICHPQRAAQVTLNTTSSSSVNIQELF